MAKDRQPLVVSYLRFSTPEQARGDSIRRQIEKSEQWAALKGWKIDDRLRDEGVSAYRGANAATGALGRILASIKSGTIPPGSYLIVENFDRLSRGELTDAIQLLLSIIRSGVTLVTLNDGREYSKDFDLTSLIISATSMARSNEESKRKSELVGAAWKRKKTVDAAQGKFITKELVPWLRIDGGKIIPKPEKVTMLREVFKLALQGRGALWITKHLNKTHGVGLSGKPWNDTYVMRTLKNRVVIGEYQPHKRTTVDGKVKRIPDGEPIQNYYPQVIDSDTFHAVQKSVRGRIGRGGPVNKAQINIFGGIMYDHEDNTVVRKTSKSWRPYYVSSGRDGRGKGGTYVCFPANQFDFVVLFRLSELFPQQGTAERETELLATEERIDLLKLKLAELGEVILQKPLKTIIAAIEKAEAELTGLEQRRDELAGEIAIHRKSSGTNAIPEEITDILLGKLTEDQRLALRESIRLHVKRVDVEFKRASMLDPKRSQRDYIGYTFITMHSGEIVHIAFSLTHQDYRSESFSKVNPYVISIMADPTAKIAKPD